MGRNHPFFILQNGENTSGPLFTEALYQTGIINANKFSFYLQQIEEDSWLDFGEPDPRHIRFGSKVVEMQLFKEDFYWGGYNTGVAIGDVDNNAFVYPTNDLYGVY